MDLDPDPAADPVLLLLQLRICRKTSLPALPVGKPAGRAGFFSENFSERLAFCRKVLYTETKSIRI